MHRAKLSPGADKARRRILRLCDKMLDALQQLTSSGGAHDRHIFPAIARLRISLQDRVEMLQHSFKDWDFVPAADWDELRDLIYREAGVKRSARWIELKLDNELDREIEAYLEANGTPPKGLAKLRAQSKKLWRSAFATKTRLEIKECQKRVTLYSVPGWIALHLVEWARRNVTSAA